MMVRKLFRTDSTAASSSACFMLAPVINRGRSVADTHLDASATNRCGNPNTCTTARQSQCDGQNCYYFHNHLLQVTESFPVCCVGLQPSAVLPHHAEVFKNQVCC